MTRELWALRSGELPSHIWGQVQEAVEVAQRTGSLVAKAQALNCRSLYRQWDHRFLESLSDAQESYRLAEQSGQVSEMGLAAVRQVNDLWELGRMVEVAELGQELAKVLFAVGSPRDGSGLAGIAAEVLLDLGRWAECREILGEALATRCEGVHGADVREQAARLAARSGQWGSHNSTWTVPSNSSALTSTGWRGARSR